MKRVIAILMLVVTLFTMFPCISAAAVQTEVEKDIASMRFDGKAWDPQAFLEKQKVKDDIYLIAVEERGFQYGGGSDDYGFYIYVYNPSHKKIIVNSEKNMVQMAVAWEDDRATDFEKFDLKLISVSEGNEYLKYKVIDHYSSIDVINMQTRVALYQYHKSKRLYEITGIEILTKGETNATEYAYGAKVEITGYEANRGQSGTNADTKKVTYMGSTTLGLEVHQVFWRTETGKDIGYRNQINGAYFAVPNDVWDNYEKLYSIRCTWEEYRMTPAIYTDDQTLYNALFPYVGKTITPGKEELEYRLYNKGSFSSSDYFSVTSYDWAYNISSVSLPLTQIVVERPFDTIGWLPVPQGEIKLNAEVIPAEYLIDYYENFPNKDLLLTNEVDEGRTAGRNYVTVNLEGTDKDGNPMFPLDNYIDNHSKWEAFWAYTWFNGGKSFNSVNPGEKYDHFTPIEYFKDEGDADIVRKTNDLLNGSTEYVMNQHFFQTEEMAKDFVKFVKESLANDMTVVLFRYAETDYFSETLSVVPEIEGHAMMFWQTLFLDFDVIWLGFHDKANNLMIVPVASSPSHGVGSGQAPNTSTDSDLVGDQLKDQANEIWERIKKFLDEFLYWAGIVGLILLAIAVVPLVLLGVSNLKQAIERLGTGERRQNGNKRKSKPKSSKSKGSRSKKK